ncbi:MAG: Gfo/Idh/MocA family oxidoreductase [Balneolaceae bacterium]|jgi:predicted dehydrogenase
MSKYKWGILGTGFIANEFAKALNLIPEAVTHSVYSRTFERAKGFADHYGFRKNCRDIDTFLHDSDLDVVYISTPNHLHCQQAIHCMQAGKHVLVEKPIALNVAQVKQIIEAAKENRRFCMEAMWSRFIPVYKEVKKLLSEEKIGDISFLGAEFGHPIAYNPSRFRFSLKKGGGSLLDLGVYPISLALMLMGKPAYVEGECCKAESGVDTLNRITMHFDNGAIADLRSTFNCQLNNGLWIGGHTDSIEVLPPISHPDKYRILQSEPYDAAQKYTYGLSDKIHQMPVISLMAQKVREKFVVPIKKQLQTRRLSYSGNGYQFEAMEVMNVLQRGELESAVMSLQDSLDVLEITDKLRRDWNIFYPGIDS